jgi:hypothetical protein
MKWVDVPIAVTAWLRCVLVSVWVQLLYLPPFTFVRDISSPTSLIDAIVCEANASFNSIKSISLGATGAMLTARLLNEMGRRPDSRYGMVTMCIGVGMFNNKTNPLHTKSTILTHILKYSSCTHTDTNTHRKIYHVRMWMVALLL